MTPASVISRFVVITTGDGTQINYIITSDGASHLSRPVSLYLTDDPEALGDWVTYSRSQGDPVTS